MNANGPFICKYSYKRKWIDVEFQLSRMIVEFVSQTRPHYQRGPSPCRNTEKKNI